jgi:hypothetical protein
MHDQLLHVIMATEEKHNPAHKEGELPISLKMHIWLTTLHLKILHNCTIVAITKNVMETTLGELTFWEVEFGLANHNQIHHRESF